MTEELCVSLLNSGVRSGRCPGLSTRTLGTDKELPWSLVLTVISE